MNSPTEVPAREPLDYLKTALTRDYTKFSGRARRSEFWYFTLFYTLISILAILLDEAFNTYLDGVSRERGAFEAIIQLLLFVPSISVSIRRMHDIGRSGWWVLINFIPLLGALYFIYLATVDSEPQPNKWGPSPKYRAMSGDPFGGHSRQQAVIAQAASSSTTMGISADTLPTDPEGRKYGRH